MTDDGDEDEASIVAVVVDLIDRRSIYPRMTTLCMEAGSDLAGIHACMSRSDSKLSSFDLNLLRRENISYSIRSPSSSAVASRADFVNGITDFPREK